MIFENNKNMSKSKVMVKVEKMKLEKGKIQMMKTKKESI